MKKLLALFLIVPVLMYCAPANDANQEENQENSEEQNKPEDNPEEQTPTVDPFAKAGPELHDGDVLQATNPNVEKFLSEVTYPDKDLSFTHVLEYYGGFNGKTYNENGEEDPAGTAFDWKHQPTSDKPCSYSIRWTADDLEEGTMTLHMEDAYEWSGDLEIAEGALYVNVTNLVPNDSYTYKVTTSSGKVLAQGAFTTTGKSSLHQVFFSGSCRNGRDLGGWKTLDGKTVRYRRMYRGGRMQAETVNNKGKLEIPFEGIGAQLDLRNSDKLSRPAVTGLEFCAPGIEEGGTWMLTHGNDDGNFGKQCFEFTVNCLRKNKPVYFHCSLGRDRTGTFDILCLGLLGVREGDISKAYEVTYFAPVGYSVSSSEKSGNPEPIFKNTRMAWAYADVAPYFWSLSQDGTFANGVEHYLLDVAGVSQQDIDDFRTLMLMD
ncbi:MAG: tyrosine-protein phosphatase [Bacteroidales bacterium]|nr:tyrosine-protein phosphatase [Bacteroidales bacterium]